MTSSTSNTPPRGRHDLLKSKEIAKFSELVMRKGFSKNISNHIISWNIMKRKMVLRNGLTNEMKMNVDMFGASMKSGISGKTNSTLIITEKWRNIRRNRNDRWKFEKKFSKPNNVLWGMSKGNILRFCAWESDNGLFLGTPWDGSTTKEEGEARDWMTMKMRCPPGPNQRRNIQINWFHGHQE